MNVILADRIREQELVAMSKEAHDRRGMKDDSKMRLIEDRENSSNPQHKDSVYYELDENGQMVRSQPKKSDADSIYYELNENGELVQADSNPRSPRGQEASFSKHSDNVMLNARQHEGMGKAHCFVMEHKKENN